MILCPASWDTDNALSPAGLGGVAEKAAGRVVLRAGVRVTLRGRVGLADPHAPMSSEMANARTARATERLLTFSNREA